VVDGLDKLKCVLVALSWLYTKERCVGDEALNLMLARALPGAAITTPYTTSSDITILFLIFDGVVVMLSAKCVQKIFTWS
jgi:hypothetical protein